MQYCKNKNTDLQLTVTGRFCDRLYQYTTLWPEFSKLFRSKGLDIILSEIKNINSFKKIKTEIRKWDLGNFFLSLSAINTELRIC